MCCPNTTCVNCCQECVCTCVVFVQDPHTSPHHQKKKKNTPKCKEFVGSCKHARDRCKWVRSLALLCTPTTGKQICLHPLTTPVGISLFSAESSFLQLTSGTRIFHLWSSGWLILSVYGSESSTLCINWVVFWSGVSDWLKNNVCAKITRQSFFCNAQSDLPAMSR